MNTLRRLIHREVAQAVVLVTLAFAALFFLFDLLEELRAVGRIEGFTTTFALINVALTMPSHLYELLPIAVLIGTVFVMARMAQSSEFTIMRTSGLGPWRALSTLLGVGWMFVALTFVVGDYLVPAAERLSIWAHAKYLNQAAIHRSTGAWLKERTPQGHMRAINVGSADAQGHMQRIRIFEFDPQGRMVLQLHAQSGHIHSTANTTTPQWELQNVRSNAWQYPRLGTQPIEKPSNDLSGVEPSSLVHSPPPDTPRVQRSTDAHLSWNSTITGDMLLAAVRRPDRMPVLELWGFIAHLKDNAQSAQRYEISFWRKVFYPLSCLVMVVLALPFAYLHFRSGSIAAKVFGGVMVGVSFFLLNNVFGYAGNLNGWHPVFTAAAPSLLYTLASLLAFAWLVLRR